MNNLYLSFGIAAMLLSFSAGAQLSGNYTIGGTSPDFSTLTEAVDSLKNGGVSGAVVFSLRSGIYDEQLVIQQEIAGSSAGNTVTFQSEANDSTAVTIMSSSGNEVLLLNDADNLIFKNLSFYTPAYYGTYLRDCSNLRFESVSFAGDVSNTYYLFYAYECPGMTLYQSVFSGSSEYGVNAGGSSHTDFVITECRFTQINGHGIYMQDISSASITDNTLNPGFSSARGISLEYCQNTLVQGNTFWVTESYAYGIYAPYSSNGSTIEDNTVQLDGQYARGIYLSANNTTIRNNTITATGEYSDPIYLSGNEGIIQGNTITIDTSGVDAIYASSGVERIEDNVITFDSDAEGGQGIYLYTSNPAKVQRNTIIAPKNGTGIYISQLSGESDEHGIIANNFVQISGEYNGYYGIYLSSVYHTDVLHNTVNNLNTDHYSAALYYSYGDHARIYNNILRAEHGLTLRLSSSGLTDCDYNDLYSEGEYLGEFSSNTYANLEDWRNGSSFDAHSLSVDPQFTSDSDLHVAQVTLNGAALNGLGITDDIDHQMRSGSPDIGADEFSVIGLDAGMSLVAPTLPLGPGTQDIVVRLTANGSVPVTVATIGWSVNGVAQTPASWTGNLTENTHAEVTLGNYDFAAGGTYSLLMHINSINGGAMQLSLQNDTIRVDSVRTAMAGGYTIGGETPDFETFAQAIQALYDLGVADAVTFLVRDSIYHERLEFNGAIEGASSANTITFRSESMDAGAVEVLYNDGRTFYAEEVGFLRFEHLRFTTGYDYSYVVETRECTDFQWRHCRFTSTPVSNNYNAHMSGNLSGPVVEDCTFRYGSTGLHASGEDSTPGMVIQRNTFEDVFQGIEANNALSPVVSNNIIHSGGGYCGLYISDPRGTAQIHHNLIIHQSTDSQNAGIFYGYGQDDGGTPSMTNNIVSISGPGQLYGIRTYNAANLLIVHNTVRISSPNIHASALEMYYGSGGNILNNIFVNTGAGYAVTDYDGNHTYDYNDYYTVGDRFAAQNESPINDLGAWQAATGRDAHSLETDPFFVSNDDLHTQAPALNGAGVSGTGVALDFDGDPRDPATPDMGADEFDLVAANAALGVLTAPLPPINSGVHPVQISVYNFGVQTLTSLDIAWEINGVAQTPYAWSGSLATGDSLQMVIGSYNFLGGIYDLRCIAQNPNGLPDEAPGNDTLWATIETALLGTYSVGTEMTDFVNIAEAANALQERGAAGDVIFEIEPGTYTEQVALGDFPGNGTYAITFRSRGQDASSVTWQYESTSDAQNYVLKLDGVSNITIEYLHIRALENYYYSVVFDLQSANDITFQHNILEGTQTGYSDFSQRILYNGSPFTLCENLQLTNNHFVNGGYALYWEGPYDNHIQTLTIQNNTFENQRATALNIANTDAVTLENNTISANHGNSFNGVSLQSGVTATLSGNVFTGTGRGQAFYLNQFSGRVEILKNSISNAGGGIIFGDLNAPTRSLFANNFIQVGDSGEGFGINGQGTCHVDIYHNSVLNIGSQQSINSSAITLYGSGGDYDLKNNVFASTGGALAIYISNSNSHQSDYNNLYSAADIWGISGNNFRYDLAQWQAATGLDEHSVSVLPAFFSNTDLHLNQASLSNAGTALASVTNDIDGDPRNPATPDIGADEFDLSADDILPLALLSPASGCATTAAPVTVVVRNVGVNDATGFSLKLLRNNVEVASENVGAFIVPANDTAHYTFTAALDLSTPGTYPLAVISALGNDGDPGNDTLRTTVTSYPYPVATAGSDSPVCEGEILHLTSSGGLSYEWSGPEGFGSSQQNPEFYPSAGAAGDYVVMVSNANGCRDTASVNVEVHPAPFANAFSNSPVCAGTTLSLSADGGVTYQWSGPNGFVSAFQNPEINEVTLDYTGDYYATVTDANGCQAVAYVYAAVLEAAGTIGSNSALCIGDTLYLTAGGGDTYLWSGPNGFSSTDAEPFIAHVSADEEGTYTVTITVASGCEQVLETNVIVNAAPVAAIVPAAITICGGTPTNLAASGGGTYLWSTGAVGNAVSVNPTTTTTYDVVVTSAQGCLDTASAVVTVNSQAPYFAFTGNDGYTGSAVEPQTGSPYQTFYFEIDYFDAEGNLPGASFPRLQLDFNGNSSYNDADDRVFVMTPVDASDTDVTDGKRYFYQTTGLNTSFNYRTSFIAQDAGGCASLPFVPVDEPNVVDFADIHIYANDITFSNNNPDPGTPLDVAATIHNDSDFDAPDFVVRLVNQYNGQIYNDITVANLPAHSTTTVNWTITTPAEVSWNPMQVFIDYTNVIDEPNELNNQAIRPFVNGEYNLPGNIAVTAVATPEESLSGASAITISGSAIYEDTAVPLSDPSVAGATVTFTLVETGQTFSTYTNSNGQFARSFSPPLTPGLYHVTGSITDFTLTGNFTAQFVIQPGPCQPDLSCSFQLSSNSVLVGESVTGSIRVTNNGCSTSAIASLLDVSGQNATPVPADAIVPALAPGESFVYHFSNPVLFNIVGTATLQATADAAFAVVENNEQNNGCLASIAVNPSLPDITVGYIASGGQKYHCQPHGFSIRIDNGGGVPTGAFQLARHVVRLADNQIEYADTVTISNVLPGSYGSVYSDFTHTFEQTGDYRIDVFADIPTAPGLGVVGELNENNNTGSVGVTVIPCQTDVRMEGIVSVAPIDAHAAPSIEATVRIANSGTAATGDSVVVAFAVGLDTIYTTHHGSLAVGASAEVSAVLPSPGTACVQLFAKADYLNLITEVSEANNTVSGQLTYDFSPGSYCPYQASKFWQTTQFLNRPVEFRVGLFNDGLFAASAVKVKFEVSGPGISGWQDWGFGTVGPVGKTGSCPYTVAAPTEYVFTQLGSYQVRITVDSDGNYTECNEGNNVMIVPVIVAEERPDLRILSQYLAPSLLNPDVGEPITLDITYENIGINNIGETFKLAWEADEAPQDTVDATGLNQNDIGTITMPSMWSSTIPGIHILRAKIDALETVEENNELNNEATRAILVGQYPNLRFSDLSVSNDAPQVNDVIDLTFEIVNEGDLSCNADVQILYVNDFGDTVLVQTLNVTIPENDSTTFVRSLTVYDAATTLVLRILNANPEEFNATDNEATLQLGVLSVSAMPEQEESCPGSADGRAVVEISGGQAPYLIQWSNNATGEVLETTAGTYQVTVTDGAANTATAAVVITTAADGQLPLIFGGPGDISLNVTDGNCPATVNWTEPQATDNCGIDTLYSNYEPGDSFGPGQTTVTYTAIDLSGNMRTYSFNVIVNAQPIALAGDNQVVCSSSINLAATPPPFGQGQWSVVEGTGTFADDTLATTTVNDLADGLNVLQWIVSNGSCGADTALVEIVVNSIGVVHVDQDATAGDQTGADWANAFINLNDALGFAAGCPSATIWVAEGVYLPTVGNNRNLSFEIPAQTTLLGGFNGAETNAGERRPDEYRTILSGNINAAGAGDNSYHVVKVEGNDVLLDGLHITGGHAENDESTGGGLLFEPASGNASLTIQHTSFYDNTARQGGAIAVIANGTTASLNLTNITFSGNHAALQGGALAAFEHSGGTIFLDLFHASFGGNTAAGGIGNQGSALYLDGAAANVRNSILWDDGNEILTAGGSATVSNSIVRGGVSGTNVQDANPRYDDVAGHDLRLRSCSPAIDAGNAMDVPATDITLGTRVYSTLPDLGAFEYDGTDYAPPILAASDAELQATMDFTDADGWTHYYYCSNDGAGDRIVMSIKKEGQDLGELGDNLIVRNVTIPGYGSASNAYDLSNADYVETSSWFVIGRYWDVDTPMPVADSILVRYYYTGKDTTDIKAAMEAEDGLWKGDTALYFFKVSGTGIDPFDEDVLESGGTYAEYRHGDQPSLHTWTKGVFNGLMYAEYYVSSFSGGGGGGSPGPDGPGGALPVELISFEGKRLNSREVQLDWQTAQELDIAGYDVQRSTDGRTWSKVGYVAGLGDHVAGHLYDFIDANALTTTSYYRLRILGSDETVEYSPVIAIAGTPTTTKLMLLPNPTSGLFRIVLEDEGISGQVFDLHLTNSAGQVVYRQAFIPNASGWTHEVDALSELPSGLYHVVIWKDGTVWQTGRVVKGQ